MLEERGYTVRKKEKEGYLHHLFFTHKDSATKVMQCPEVLIVDATYKTNVYKMPLINCVGVDNIGNSKSLHTFQIGMAWVSNEVEETYTWFLEQLKMVIYDITNTYPEVIMTDKDLALRSAADKVFPGAKKMLCIWHMLAQNLRTSTQKYFDSKDDYDNFAAAVKSYAYATTDALVTEAFDKITITTKKSKNASKIMEYLDTWKSDRSCWMQLYTQHYPHMGIHSTQRGEGSHSALKTAIEAASGLEQVFGHIDRAFRLHQLGRNAKVAGNILAADPFIRCSERFQHLLGKISLWAIDKIKVIECNTSPEIYGQTCLCSLRINFKLLCPHTIPPSGPIPLELIHPRWLLKTPGPTMIQHINTDKKLAEALYMVEQKISNITDDCSKHSFLEKLQQLTEEGSQPTMLPVAMKPKGRPTNTKRNKLRLEYQIQAEKEKHQEIPKSTTRSSKKIKVELGKSTTTIEDNTRQQTRSDKLYDSRMV